MGLKAACLPVQLILAFAVITAVSGQSMPGGFRRGAGSAAGTMGGGQELPFDFSGVQTPASPLPGAILPMDNSINENEYLIGSGDVFFVSVVESPQIRHTAAVDLSGRAFISGIGLVDVGKIPYAEAKKIIAEFVASRLRNPSEVYVTLVQAKKATVSFIGSVRNPGAYEFTGATRLLDAIRAANDGDLPSPSNADLRQVQLTSGDSTAVYDILAYLYKNDETQNPYIYPGDRVRINSTTNSVFINGAIKFPVPSSYPIREGETVREFLTMFTLDNVADTNNIIVFRSADNSKKTLSSAELDFVLNHLDAITIPVRKNLPGIHTVYIYGEVASPGHYPITENSTSARQLIEMAGGVNETGNMNLAAIIRPAKNLPDRFNSGIPQLSTVRPERAASVSMASASLDYTVIRVILYNADKIMLEPGDQIVIPKKDNFVYISGAVRNPGVYPFLSGRDSEYYIKQAGGYSSNANRKNVQVFLRYGEAVQSIEPRCVEPGSVIVVPSSVEYKVLGQVILPVLSTIATIVMVGLTAVSISR